MLRLMEDSIVRRVLELEWRELFPMEVAVVHLYLLVVELPCGEEHTMLISLGGEIAWTVI